MIAPEKAHDYQPATVRGCAGPMTWPVCTHCLALAEPEDAPTECPVAAARWAIDKLARFDIKLPILQGVVEALDRALDRIPKL
jgi:hypothetical protein